MKFPLIALFFTLVPFYASADASMPTPAQVLGLAEKKMDEGSYAQALEVMQILQNLPGIAPGDKERLTYLTADASWRNLASTNQTDPQLIQNQRDRLEELAAQLQKAETSARPPQLWAEIQESLGDSYWVNNNARDWSKAWAHYQKALDWWAGSSDLNIARERYLSIVFRAANPQPAQPYYTYGYWGNRIPLQYLENAVKLAQERGQRAEAHFLLATAYIMQGQYVAPQVRSNFEAALKAGKGTGWYDNALYQYAQWQQTQGGSHYDENGNWIRQPDFAAALKLYRQLLSEYSEGESRYWRQAQSQAEQITRQELVVLAPYHFLPDTTVTLNLRTRNVEGVSVEVFPLKMADIRFPGSESTDKSTNWWERLDLKGRKSVYTWKQEKPGEPYVQQSEEIRIEGLKAGLYAVRATAGGQTTWSWLLVTRAALVTKTDSENLHVWAVDAESGQPLEKAKLRVWFAKNENSTRTWQSSTGDTRKDGLTQLKLPTGSEHWQWMLFAETEQGPAVINNQYWGYNRNDIGQWRVYALTDRPAYRPEDAVHWKFSARLQKSLAAYSVPAGEKLHWRIVDPRGSEVAQGNATLNDYGSAWGELALSRDMPLGMFRIEFRYKGNWIGSEELFRLEEYKLPEFKVTVTTQGPDGEPQTAFRLGERVAVAVQADYYFGGAVTNADVEVVVRQKPFYPGWHPIMPYPWLYDAQPMLRGRGYYGPGQEVQRETLKTDDTGRASFVIEAPANQRQDLEYTVEARVVDESRREITGSGSIRVTRQPYFVYLQPQRQLYRPGEEMRVTIKSLNANESPVRASGRLILNREEWQEIWIGPRGEEITGKEYRQRQRSTGLFSRTFEPTEWRKVREGYDVEQIASQPVMTDAEGEATFAFTLPKAGYYTVKWFSQAEDGYPIKADTAVWCADEASVDIGFQGGLKLVFDQDAFRAGESSPVMITAPTAGRHIWFTVETDGLLESSIILMDGTVKLLNLDVTDARVPNVFLGAALFQGCTLYQDAQEAIVPPVAQFLDVSVTPNANLYQPRDTGRFTVETRDHAGSPVQAEVALSLFDEAVLYIQPLLAGDPREFFYGQKRYNQVQTFSSVFERGFWSAEMQKQRQRGGVGVSGYFKSDLDDSRRFSNQSLLASEAGVAVDAFAAAPARAMAMPASEATVSGGEVPLEGPAVVVRSDFRATVFWQPNVMTGPDGTAEVEVAFPDSLTTWKAEAWALGLPGKVGQGSAEVKTQLPLIARLQMPRFLVTGDAVTLSGVINNNTDEELTVEVSLTQVGDFLELDSASQSLTVPARGSARADFSAKALLPGEPELTLTAKGTRYADAMSLSLPVYEHGIDKFLAQSGKMTGDVLTVTLTMPEFRPEGASFEIYATPSLAATMLDALPYLAQYPYGCVEQTMSRFLPAVVVAKTLKDLGLSKEDVVERAFGGIEKRTAGEGGEQLYDLKPMVGDGLARLYDFQHGDGGWGWWKGGSSDLFMSGYVVWGLTLCQQSGITVREDVLERGRDFLGKRLVEAETQQDLAAWMLHALASRFEGNAEPSPTRFETKAFAELWKNRDEFNAYTRALLTLSAVQMGFTEEAATLARNLENGVILDTAPQGSILAPGNPRNSAELATAHWGSDGLFYRWSDGGVEATSFVVKALLAVADQGTAASGGKTLSDKAVNWLVQNRRGAQWSNTRDTAIAILALNDYLKASGELDAAIDYAITLNGETIASESISAGHGPLAPSKFSVDASKLKVGENLISFTRSSGTAPLYFSARANFFTLEDPITPAGNVVFVQRDFYRIRPVPTLLDGYAEEKTQIESGAEVQSGDRVEVVLLVQAKNHLEYLVFEDLKAAGFEATELQSGAPLYAREVRVLPDASGQIKLPAEDAKDRYTGRQRWVYQELRDRQIASFVDKLPEGYWELRYTLRAETPGAFSALPVLGHAMYVPEIRANSAEFKVTVEE